jgi:sterol desaturase/sphingolipid hydroxylase (fatty acid hydroxylase superfamily)
MAGFFHSPYTDKIVARLAYPLVMFFALTGHYLCIHNGVGLQVATYVPVLLGALAVTLLEQGFPHRHEWLPNRADVVNDSTYTILVQVLLPRFLGFFVAIVLLRTVQGNGLVLEGIWPHQWPLAVQAILMLVTAEFPRYWVHRLAHSWNPLWQFHAVHHSPHKLYWLNVGRFHPLEKALQYLFDVLPFIVLGVSENVLALYFVFYALNGFFQHCNIELRLGVLNHIISGPELHRWHHSKSIDESSTNYGNNLIIWDGLFGLRYLPANRLVGDLGLKNRRYPMTFLRQLGTPFRNGLDKAA